jgi:thiosulfate reductase cytochrome b subunit
MSKIFLYTFHERVWHWIQALVIMLLMYTGMEIHHPSQFHLLGFDLSTRMHNVLGFALIINAILGLLYHVFTEEFLQFVPQPRGFFDMAHRQAMFYLGGIFRGEEHPIDKNPDNKLNPLQRVTYLLVLNIMLPLQLITGVLIWGAQRWPHLADRVGDLPLLGPLHTLIAWLFGAFLILHIYLATTGHTPMANIMAMLTGWEELPDGQEPEPATRRYGLSRLGQTQRRKGKGGDA